MLPGAAETSEATFQSSLNRGLERQCRPNQASLLGDLETFFLGLQRELHSPEVYMRLWSSTSPTIQGGGRLATLVSLENRE